jgi:D-alanyl-D-alanine carboxypeptidase
VLQLAAEGGLSLNDSVQKWLPGAIAGLGYHPGQITIRQLLQQASGLRDYTSDPRFQTAKALARTWRPQQLVDIALRLWTCRAAWSAISPGSCCHGCSVSANRRAANPR